MNNFIATEIHKVETWKGNLSTKFDELIKSLREDIIKTPQKNRSSIYSELELCPGRTHNNVNLFFNDDSTELIKSMIRTKDLIFPFPKK